MKDVRASIDAPESVCAMYVHGLDVHIYACLGASAIDVTSNFGDFLVSDITCIKVCCGKSHKALLEVHEGDSITPMKVEALRVHVGIKGPESLSIKSPFTHLHSCGYSGHFLGYLRHTDAQHGFVSRSRGAGRVVERSLPCWEAGWSSGILIHCFQGYSSWLKGLEFSGLFILLEVLQLVNH